MKPNTIPIKYQQEATLSAWLLRFPFMCKDARKWGLARKPISERCKALYPDIVRVLHPDSMPMVINFPMVHIKEIAA